MYTGKATTIELNTNDRVIIEWEEDGKKYSVDVKPGEIVTNLAGRRIVTVPVPTFEPNTVGAIYWDEADVKPTPNGPDDPDGIIIL